jgi:hypothetical protein
MRPFDNAAASAAGGATIALPTLTQGIGNEAQLGLGQSLGFWAGSAIPYGITGWQTGHFQGLVSVGANNGFGLDITHSATNDYAEQRFKLMYGRRLGEKILLGASGDVLRASAGEYGSVTSATFGLSALAQPLPEVWLGAKIQNPFQQKIGDDLIPTVLRMGAAWQPSSLLIISTEFQKDLERAAQARFGFEYRPVERFALRAGVRTGEGTRIGFGTGLRLKNGIALDVGSEWHPNLGMTPSAMVSWIKPK